jgi:TATA-box binding protein (TBP) (component of TFIID and TFIIIB)
MDSAPCSCQVPKLHNVKFHFKGPIFQSTVELQQCLLRAAFQQPCPLRTVKYCRNFIVLRVASKQRLTFTLFPKSGHVNVSGVRNFDHIPSALAVFNKIFDWPVSIREVAVDNTTSSGSFSCCLPPSLNPKTLDIVRLKGHFDSGLPEGGSLSLRPDHFPGCVLKVPGYNSVIIFANCKYVIVGAKRRKDILQTREKACAIIRHAYQTIALAT